MKNKQLETEQLLNQFFSPEKIKAIEISVLCCLPVEKCNIFLEFLLPCTHSVVYPKNMSSGFQTTVKANELSSVMKT